MITSSQYDYLTNDDDDDYDYLEPSHSPSASSNKKKPTWPRSRDGLYSPYTHTVDRITTEVKKYKPKVSTALVYDSAQALREGVDANIKYDKDFWKRVRLDQDKFNYIRRQKRNHIKALNKHKIFREARLLSYNYYMCQKMYAFGYLRQQFLIQLETILKHLRSQQKEEHFLFSKNLQTESNFITTLYEDYYQPINTYHKMKKHPMFHELYYKEQFQKELTHRLIRIEWLFSAKQRAEKQLCFLWSIDNHNITMLEKEKLYSAQDRQKNDSHVRNRR